MLHERNFARYLASVVVSHLGNGMANVALAFAVLGFGTPTDLGIVLLAREIPMIVFLLLGGVFADRLPRRTILVGTDLVKGAAQVATAVLLFSGAAQRLERRACSRSCSASPTRSRGPTTIGLVKETVSDAHLQQANALPALAEHAVDRLAGARCADRTFGSPAIAIAVDAVTFFVSAAAHRVDAARGDASAPRRRRSSATCATAGASSSRGRGSSRSSPRSACSS